MNISNDAGRISQVKLGAQLRASYRYDGKSRLAESVRVNVANAGTTRYIHDQNDRIIAEVSSTGQSIREYIWLDDLPVAVLDGSVDQANPVLFWVHADHLGRPVMMTNAGLNVVWRAHYEPFGVVHSITGPAANDNRFPGQLFQLESGLAYNLAPALRCDARAVYAGGSAGVAGAALRRTERLWVCQAESAYED